MHSIKLSGPLSTNVVCGPQSLKKKVVRKSCNPLYSEMIKAILVGPLQFDVILQEDSYNMKQLQTNFHSCSLPLHSNLVTFIENLSPPWRWLAFDVHKFHMKSRWSLAPSTWSAKYNYAMGNHLNCLHYLAFLHATLLLPFMLDDSATTAQLVVRTPGHLSACKLMISGRSYCGHHLVLVAGTVNVQLRHFMR